MLLKLTKEEQKWFTHRNRIPDLSREIQITCTWVIQSLSYYFLLPFSSLTLTPVSLGPLFLGNGEHCVISVNQLHD